MRTNYVSRTKCAINEVSTNALIIRAEGITATREAIKRASNTRVDIGQETVRKVTRNLIASLNFPMYVVRRELSHRGVEL